MEAFEEVWIVLCGVRARAKKSTIGGRDDAHLHYLSDPSPTFREDQPIMPKTYYVAVRLVRLTRLQAAWCEGFDVIGKAEKSDR